MRAVAVAQFGADPVLVEVPDPVPGPGEVLIRLTGASYNPFDRAITSGYLRERGPHVFPLIVGVDGSGTVVARGDGVARFDVGDAVYGQMVHSPYGEGTYAEYVKLPAGGWIVPAPATVSLDEAAAVPTAGMTALALLDVADIGNGSTVLVVGATGGVGSFATQIAANRGARVIGTARGTAEKFVRDLGASDVVDYSHEPIGEQVRSIAPEGVDVLVDCASDAAGFAACTELVRDGGLASSIAFAANLSAPAPRGIRLVNFNVRGGQFEGTELLTRLSAQLDAGQLRVPVESKVSLEDASAAYARIQSGGARGKMVISIS
jgi:NADPH:quinone reductase-like Zn-dependent oxidoreductase